MSLQLNYSRTALGSRAKIRASRQTPVAKNAKRQRVKSPNRDALFRPWFQALDALDREVANGGASVTFTTPSHSTFPSLALDYIPTSTSHPLYTPERLTLSERGRADRFWRSFCAETPRLRLTPAPWRELSDEGCLEWFHHAVRASGPYSAFSLNLSPEVEKQARSEPSAVRWLSDRIARRLKVALGRKSLFWFALESTDFNGRGRLHLHGEISADPEELEAARKALRLAAGEWKAARQHQAHTKESPSAVWSCYAAKQAIYIRPLKGRLGKALKRPISGNDWLFASNAVRSRAGELYTARRDQVLCYMRAIKSINTEHNQSVTSIIGIHNNSRSCHKTPARLFAQGTDNGRSDRNLPTGRHILRARRPTGRTHARAADPHGHPERHRLDDR